MHRLRKPTRTFRKFLLSEAVVSESNVPKVMQIYQRLLNKYAGGPIRPFGGDDLRPAKLARGGKEYILCSRDRRAWGFNYFDGGFQSISVWKKGRFNTVIRGNADPAFTPADATIDVSDTNITQIGMQLMDQMLNPKPGKYVIKDDKLVKEERIVDEYTDSAVILTEGRKRVKTEQDFWRIVDKYRTVLNYDPDVMTKLDFENLADNAGIIIPNWVHAWGTGKAPKTGKGARTTWDVTVFNPKNRKKHQIFVSGRDPDTNRFYSVEIVNKDIEGNLREPAAVSDKRVARMESTMRTWKERIINPGPEDINVYGVDVDTLFGQLEKGVIKLVKRIHAFLVFGGSGTGKSYVVTHKLAEMGLKQRNTDNINPETNPDYDSSDISYYTLIKGRMTTAKMVHWVFKNSGPGQIIVFDDSDSFMDDKQSANILKAMLESGDNRWVTFDSKDPEIATITNLAPKDQVRALEILYDINNGKWNKYTDEELNIGGVPDIDKDGNFRNRWKGGLDLVTSKWMPKTPNKFKYQGKMMFIFNRALHDVDSAVRSRAVSLDMSLTPVEVALRMKSLIDREVLGDRNVPTHVKHDIVDILVSFLDEKSMDMDELNMRTFLHCEDHYIEFPDVNLKEDLSFIVTKPNRKVMDMIN